MIKLNCFQNREQKHAVKMRHYHLTAISIRLVVKAKIFRLPMIVIFDKASKYMTHGVRWRMLPVGDYVFSVGLRLHIASSNCSHYASKP